MDRSRGNRHGRSESFALLSQFAGVVPSVSGLDANRVDVIGADTSETPSANAASLALPSHQQHQYHQFHLRKPHSQGNGHVGESSTIPHHFAPTTPTTGTGNKTAEATMRILFARFIELAETKLLALVYAHGGDMSIDLSVSLRPGVDPEFDGVMKGLGAVARHCQKDLIEGLMAWRTDKSVANRDRARVPSWVAPIYLLKEMDKIVYNRQMMVSNFILLRAWIEIVQHMTKDMLQDSLATKMEYVAFNQLRYENPELVATNPTCRAHIDLNAEFLGKLSNIRFAKVSDGFVKEISELSKAVANRDPALQALKLEICIRAMRFIKLKIYPMDALEETVEFLNIFAGFFGNSLNPRIQHAYCDIFVELLEPIVAVATAEVNVPTWKDGIETLFNKAMRMITKKGHIQHSLPLATTSLCLSRPEFFQANLASVIDVCISKLRERNLKNIALVSLTRLLWVSAHRTTTSDSPATTKRVESLLKLIFPPRVALIHPTEVPLDLLVRMVYIAMVKYMENMMEIFSLLLLSVDMSGVVQWTPLSGSAGGGGGGGGVGTSGGTSMGTLSGTGMVVMGSVKNQSLRTMGSVVGTGTSLGGSSMASSVNVIGSKRDATAASTGVGSMGSGTMTSRDVDSVFSVSPDSDGSTLREREAWNSLKRKLVAFRSFLLLLADVEEALESSNTLGGVTVLPWSNGFGGTHAVNTNAGVSSNTSSGNGSGGVLIQGKIKLTAPPFPILHLSEQGDMLALFSIHDQSGAITANSLAGDHSLEASWVSAPTRATTVSKEKGWNLSVAIANSTQQRMSNNLKIFMDRTNNVFGTILLALDKSCGSHFWHTGEPGWFFNTQTASTISVDNVAPAAFASSRRNSLDDKVTLGTTSFTSLTNDPTAVGTLRKWSQYEILKNCIDCLPRLCPTGVPAERIIEMLASYLYHVDEQIRISAVQALIRIGKIIQGVSDNVAGCHFWVFKNYPFRRGRSLAEATAKLILEASSRLLTERASDGMYHIGMDETMIEQTGPWVVSKLIETWLGEMKDTKLGGDTMADVEAAIFDVETWGLIYLCSTNYVIRGTGIQLLRKSRDLEDLFPDSFQSQPGCNDTRDLKASHILQSLPLRNHDSRIISILEEAGKALFLQYYFGTTGIVEQGPLQDQNHMHNLSSSKDCLIKMAISDMDDEAAIWDRALPTFSQYVLEYGHPAVLHRFIAVIGNRLHSLNIGITTAEIAQASASSNVFLLATTQTSNLSKVFGLNPNGDQVEVLGPTPPQEKNAARTVPISIHILEQWSVLLKFSFAIIEIVDLFPMPHLHLANVGPSNPSSLFRMISSYLFMENDLLRRTSIECVSLANWRSYKSMFEVLYSYMKIAASPKKATNLAGLESVAPTVKITDHFRTELTHVVAHLTDFMNYDIYRSDENMFRSVVLFISDICHFLCDPEVQLEWEFSDLRYHFCVLVERFYQQVLAGSPKIYSNTSQYHRSYEPILILRYFPFDLRHRIFSILETWSGYGKNASLNLEIQQKCMIKYLEAISKDGVDVTKHAEKMNAERTYLQQAAIKAMGILVHGPLYDKISNGQFVFADIHQWISDLFSSNVDEYCIIATSATSGILLYNGASNEVLTTILGECYAAIETNPSSAIGSFNAIVNIFCGEADDNESLICGAHPEYPCIAPKIVALALFKVGDSDPKIRKKAVCLMRSTELRVWKETSLSSKLAADNSSTSLPLSVYKQKQIYLSSVWASARGILTYFILSEFSQQIEQISSRDAVKDALNIMIPWIHNVQLATGVASSNVYNVFLNSDTDTVIRDTEYLLTSLFYITVCFGDEFPGEVEAIWTHLLQKENCNPEFNLQDTQSFPEDTTVSHVHSVLDYLLALGVSRRNPLIIMHSKKVLSFLAQVLGPEFVFQSILSRINPISFTPMDSILVQIGVPSTNGQYCIDISSILMETSSRPPLTFGGLLSTFLVELLGQISYEVISSQVSYILHIVIIQLDHFISLICDQMKILLIHLLEKIPTDATSKKDANKLISKLLSRGDKRLWTYEDISPDHQQIRSSEELGQLVAEVLPLFSQLHTDFLTNWSLTSLFFAVNCPVRHAACRSLQIMQSLKPAFNIHTFGELLLRFSSTAGDKVIDIQSYSLEILMTMKSIIERLIATEVLAFPQLLWATVAMLSTPLEHEFIKGVELLMALVTKVDLNDSAAEICFLQVKPVKWKGVFTGIQPIVMRGIHSVAAEGACLNLLNTLALIKSDALVDSSDTRMLSLFLANFPRLMQGFESDPYVNGGNLVGFRKEDTRSTAETLAKFADRCQKFSFGRLFLSYSKQRFRTLEDFIQQFVFSLRDNFFPQQQAVAIQIVTSLLANKLPFYQKWTLRLLKLIIPLLSESLESQDFELIDMEKDLILPCIEALKGSSGDIAASVLEMLLTGESTKNDKFLRKNYGQISQEAYEKVMHLMENGDAKPAGATGWKVVGDLNRSMKATRYNLASVVVTCGISSIVTQIPFMKQLNAKPTDAAQKAAALVVSYRVPSLPQPKSLLTDSQKKMLFNCVTIFDDMFVGDNPASIQELDLGVDQTGFKHILSQTNLGVQVTMRLNIPFQNATLSQNFITLLTKNIANCLRTDETTVLIDHIDDSSLFYECTGMIVTVSLTGGGLLGDGLIAAAQAEELLALITERENLEERDILWKGEVTSSLDSSFVPNIILNFRGMTISYIPEGLRYTLPHRANMGDVSASKLLGDGPSVSAGKIVLNGLQAQTKSVENGIEALRIFPAAFELVVQLHVDLIALIQDINTNDTQATVMAEKIMIAIKSVRLNDAGYCPSLLQFAWDSGTMHVSVDEEALTGAGHRLIQAEPSRISAFLAKREHQVQSINSQISSYLSARRKTGSEIAGGQNSLQSVQAVGKLGVSLLALHCSILSLHGTFDDFLGVSEEQNQARMDESLRCVQFRSILNDLLS
ncbi:cell morphogenesis N-terminal-domain-containing protein [Chytriomyces sp. MP71]|nr:cell morphogenesis N-terminal-domain-containing protein [Chytriomyces sp. MP71]